MGSTITRRIPRRRGTNKTSAGFTLVEVMISAAIVLIGLLAVLASFGAVIAATEFSQEDMIAKQKALEAVESIFTARTTQQITFAQIANQGSGGIFRNGYQPLLAAGPDGLVGTGDDVNFPDGILGTADDTPMSLANFQRQILISNVLEADGVTIDPNLKQITVNVQYVKNQTAGTRTYTTNALISSYR